MKRSLIFKYFSIALVVSVWGCSPKQVANKTSNEVYDDLYAQIGETSPNTEVADNSNVSDLNQNSEGNFGTRKSKSYSTIPEGSNEYYSENSLDSRDYTTSPSSVPGYREGYQDAVADNNRYNWGNSWNNGFNSFSRFNGFNSWGNSWNNPGVTIMLGNSFGNRFNRFNSWGNGFYDPFYAYNPYNGFGSYGMYNNFYDPFYSGYGFGGNNFFTNNYYGNGWINTPVYYGNNSTGGIAGADRGNRNYGPRSTGRNNGGYNDQFTNTPRSKPADPNVRKGTTFSETPNSSTGQYGTGAGGGYKARERGGYSSPGSTNSNAANGNTVTSNNRSDNTRSNSINRNIGRTAPSENTYYARPRGGSIATTSDNSGNYQRSTSPAADNSSRSYTRSRSNDNSSQSSSSYSSPSYSSGSSSSSSNSSSGSSSSGSSGGSRSGGGGSTGGSRGPR